MMEVSKEEDEDNAKDLCNYKSTLLYGTKLLLHNTKMCLLHGRTYSLMDGNNSGKTTLRRTFAFANNSMEASPTPISSQPSS